MLRVAATAAAAHPTTMSSVSGKAAAVAPVVLFATCMAMTATTANSSASRMTKLEEEKNCNAEKKTLVHEDDDYQIDVSFVQKLSNKPYLQHAKSSLPSTLRVLTVDVPQVAECGFRGGRVIKAPVVFCDGVAPDKKLEKAASSTQSYSSIEQKAWVTSVMHCYDNDRVMVEVAQADTARFNPSNRIQQKHQYSRGSRSSSSKSEQEEKSEKHLALQMVEEVDAPWHQYAWKEELEMRIAGKVVFGAPMEACSKWTHFFLGAAYLQTVHSSSSSWNEWLFFWRNRRSTSSDGYGLDPTQTQYTRAELSKTNTASNKPHAVIAHATITSNACLRLLQKVCKEQDVPLFVIHDAYDDLNSTASTISTMKGQRRYHYAQHIDVSSPVSLGSVLKQVRQTIKKRMIQTALQDNNAYFHHGRLIGRLEATYHNSRPSVPFGWKQKPQQTQDWSRFTTEQLQDELMKRGVLLQQGNSKHPTFSPAMEALAQKYREPPSNKQYSQSTPTPQRQQQNAV